MKVRIKAISFDLDDTLWPCHCVIQAAEDALYTWLQRVSPRITAQHTLDDMRRQREQTARQRPDIAHDLTRLRHATLTRCFRETGYAESMADEAMAVFLAARNRVEPYADTLPALEYLAQHYPLIALTNGNADIRRIESMERYFVDAVSAADAGAAKPDPAMFRIACRRLGIRSGELLHVGDDPLRDVHAAHATGSRAVWLNRSAIPWPEDEGLRRPHHEIRSLEEVTRLLDENTG